ncbi:hypothetical protein G6F56_009294 [Rhizopus delemar]|nr:hypothetical protein G6F56_009294 [Rhizopus delemar]
MMIEENNVGPLATPTRFLYENNQWNLTPSLSNEMNPFDCNFPPVHALKENKWHPYMSPKADPTLSPSTPPMTLSQSPVSSSISSISPRNSLGNIEEEIPKVTRRTTRQSRKRARSTTEDEYIPRASGHGGRKRCIVFEGEDAEDRRKKFLERNRVAAYKCRQKKKNWMQELEQRAEMSSARNEELRQTVSQLKEESMYLRNLLLSHGNCDCESVQSYLRKTSAQITSNVCPREESNYMLPQPTTYYNSTGLTPFLNTVINKPDRIPESMEVNDYFSQAHMA